MSGKTISVKWAVSLEDNLVQFDFSISNWRIRRPSVKLLLTTLLGLIAGAMAIAGRPQIAEWVVKVLGQ
jgi:hypothetical protein